MRNVILQEFVTLDGLAAGPNGEVDFIPASNAGDQSFGRRQLRFMDSVGTILLGSTTYTMFSQFWPQVTTGDEKEFADRLNATPKVVFSRTLKSAPWGQWKPATIADGDAAEEVRRLKRGPGKDMLMWGSIALAQSLMKEHLIDEFQLIVCPLVMGAGKALFAEQLGAFNFRLQHSESFDRGAVLLTYREASR